MRPFLLRRARLIRSLLLLALLLAPLPAPVRADPAPPIPSTSPGVQARQILEVDIQVTSLTALEELQRRGFSCQGPGTCSLELSPEQAEDLRRSGFALTVTARAVEFSSETSAVTALEDYVEGSNGSDYSIAEPLLLPCGAEASSAITLPHADPNAVVTRVVYSCLIQHSDVTDLVVRIANSQHSEPIWNRAGLHGSDNNQDDDPEVDADIELINRESTTFSGDPVNQIWYLKARDCAPSNTGSIDSWSIRVYYLLPTPTPTQTPTSTQTRTPTNTTVFTPTPSATLTSTRTATLTPTITPTRTPGTVPWCDGVTQIPQSECLALVNLYNQTGGPSWNNRNGWLTNNAPCNWHGVQCDAGHVSWLDLTSNGLTGSIPDGLVDLERLGMLSLGDNRLTGSIPSILGNLQGLGLLYLYGNELSGPIPESLGNLHGLGVLSLGDNQLTGAIPPGLGGLTSLWAMALNNNYLSGTVPETLGTLTNLRRLSLDHNPFEGALPASLANLTLDNLWFDATDLCEPRDSTFQAWLGQIPDLRRTGILCGDFDCSLVSQIPQSECQALVDLHVSAGGPGWLDERGWLENPDPCFWEGVVCDVAHEHVVRLNLDANTLRGTINPTLGNLTELQQLDLSYNFLSGPLPPELGNLNHLTRLDLSGNLLSGSIPPGLGGLQQLTGLALQWNQLSGSIPASLGDLGSLTTLWMYHNQLSGEIPSTLGNLGQLGWLDLQANQLGGTIPESFGDLSHLNYLYLNDNELKGGIPSSLGELTELMEVDLSHNHLAGTIPASLGGCSRLESLTASDNQLSGSIPAELGGLKNLRYLFLDQNELNGSIPTSLSNMSNLRDLHLEHNRFDGTIPSSLGDIPLLWGLALSDNQLTGPIPASLGNLSRLNWLLLDDNQLTGPIPAALGGIPGLDNLSLSGNQLTGPIPTTFAGLTRLEELRVDDNLLQGPLPQELTALHYLSQFYFDSTLLCEPRDPAFKTWLNSIADLRRSGLLCEYSCNSDEIVPAECLALVDLYDLTNGQSWRTRTGWLSSDSPCTWSGVTCAGGQLTGLDLHGQLLRGPLPASLGNLTQLTSLDLHDNLLAGGVPGSIGALTALRHLSLDSNPLAGALPRTLMALNLTSLHFDDTELHEPNDEAFQTWLGAIPDLQRTGRPAPVASCFLPLILTSPPALSAPEGAAPSTALPEATVAALEESMERSQTTDIAIPDPPGTGCSVETSGMSVFMGAPDLARVTRVVYSLRIVHSHVQDLVVRLATGVRSVTVWNRAGGATDWGLDDDAATDQDIELISREFVTQFDGEPVNSTWKIFAQDCSHGFAGCIDSWSVRLYYQTVPFCAAVSEIPQPECQALLDLYSQTNGPSWTRRDGWATTTTPCSWNGVQCGSNHVTRIYEMANGLTGSLPASLGNLPYLQYLNLAQNALSGTIPDALGNLTALQELWLGDNQLTGGIPATLSSLHNLKKLDLGNNRLTGFVPSSLGSISGLTALWLSGNQLSGPIPSSLSNLASLTWLGLHANRLTGIIPDSLGNLQSLRSLQLSGNRLTGGIPDSLGNLTALYELGLSRNQLSGGVPSSLSRLTNLDSLTLYENNLSGPLPLSLVSLTLNLFHFHQTALCVPSDPYFRAWLASIPYLVSTNVSCDGPTPTASPTTAQTRTPTPTQPSTLPTMTHTRTPTSTVRPPSPTPTRTLSQEDALRVYLPLVGRD